MFRIIKQVFIVILRFSRFLAAKCVSLNDEKCMTRPTPINLNYVELYYYPFMISLEKYNISCNAVDELSTKICVPSEIKGVKLFKGALSGLRQFFATKRPLKMIKNAFSFTLKALFFLKKFKFLSWSCRKMG